MLGGWRVLAVMTPPPDYPSALQLPACTQRNAGPVLGIRGRYHSVIGPAEKDSASGGPALRTKDVMQDNEVLIIW